MLRQIVATTVGADIGLVIFCAGILCALYLLYELVRASQQ